mgnify:CR=1 FL=1
MYQNSLVYVKKIFNATIRQVLGSRIPAHSVRDEAEVVEPSEQPHQARSESGEVESALPQLTASAQKSAELSEAG